MRRTGRAACARFRVAHLLVVGFAWLALAAACVPAEAAPGLSIASVTTLDDGQGRLHGLVVTLSAQADLAGLRAADFTLAGCGCDHRVVLTGPGPGRQIVLRFDPEADTAARPTLAYHAADGRRIHAGAAALPDDRAPRPSSDGASPAVTGAVPLDRDGDGLLDALDVTFSEPVRDAKTVLAGWRMGGRGPAGTSGVRDDATLRLEFAEHESLPASAAPRVTGAAGAADAAGNLMVPYDSEAPAASGSSPVRILHATAAGFGSRQVNVTFSGVVVPQEDAGSPVFSSDLAFQDLNPGGAGALARVQHRVGARWLSVELDSPLLPGDDGVDRVAVVAGALVDEGGQAIPAHAMPILVDRTAPAADLGPSVAALGPRSALLRLLAAPPAGEVVEVRHALSPLTAETFAAAPVVARVAGASEHAVAGLAPDEEHHFAVQAVDGAGHRGPLFTARAVTPPDAEPPATPAAFQVPAANVSGGTALVAWLAPDDDGAPAASYELRWSRKALTAANFAGGASVAVPSPAAPGTPQGALVHDLPPGATVHFGLRARDDVGNVGAFAQASLTLPSDTTPPPAPTLATARAAGGNVTITWDGVVDPDGPVTYRGVLSRAADAKVTVADREVGSPWSPDAPGRGTWYAHVAAFSAGGSAQGTPIALALDETPPGRVEDLGVEPGPAPMSASLAWTAPEDPDGEILYELLWRPAGGGDAGSWDAATVVAGPLAAAGPASATVAGLPAGTRVELAVRGVDGSGNRAAPSNAVRLDLPPDESPPDWSPALAFGPADGAAAANPGVRLGWTPARDGETPVLYRYAFSRQGTHDFGDGDPTTAEPWAAAPGLAPGTWHLHVRAESAGGATDAFHASFRIEPIDAAQVAAWNRQVVLRVEPTALGNRLSWTLPEGVPYVEGLQAWVSGEGGFVPLRTLRADEPEFTAGLLHGSPANGTRYAVTLFYGEAPGLGYWLDEVPDGLAALSGIQSGDAAGGWWMRAAWVAGGALAVVALGAGALWWLRRRAAAGTRPVRRRRKGSGGEPELPPATPGNDWNSL